MKTTTANSRIYCKTDNCRRYANLNDDGFCPTCKPPPPQPQEPSAESEYSSCTICELEISNGDTTIGCDVCGKWAHPKCAGPAELVALIEAINNHSDESTALIKGLLIWICPKCSNTSKQIKISDSSIEVVSNAKDTTNNESGEVTNSLNRESDFSKKPICKHYRLGRCNRGDNCNFSHPKKCLNYSRFGREGCSGGYANCKLMHPVICKSSLYRKQCFDPQCTLNHLKGTVRNPNMAPGSSVVRDNDRWHGRSQSNNSYSNIDNRNYDRDFPPSRSSYNNVSQNVGNPPDFLEMKNTIMLMQQQISSLASYIMPVRPSQVQQNPAHPPVHHQQQINP